MKLRNFIALLLSLVLIIGCFAGCGKKETTSDNLEGGLFGDEAFGEKDTDGDGVADDTQQGTASGSTTSSGKGGNKNQGTDSDRKEGDGFHATGFPIGAETVELTVLTYRSDGNPLDWNQMEFVKQYEKMTNVKINWNLVTAGALKDRITMLMASGNYPDIFISIEGVLSDADVYTNGTGNVFWNMADSLEKYAPNLYSLMQKDSDVKAAILQQNGAIYTLPMIQESSPGSYWNINKKWLDKLGLSVPKTTTELTKVLQAFKNSDPDGDGVANQIPFCANCYLPDLFGPWGVYFEWANNIMIDKKGKAQYIFTMNEMQYGMTYWKRLKDQGLAKLQDPQISETEFQQLLSTGKVGCFLWSSPYTSMSEDLFDDYVLMPVPTAPASEVGDNLEAGVKRYSPKVYGNATVIFRTCRNKEVALRWLDYFYSAEGNAFKNYNTKYMKKASNGKYYIDIPEGETALKHSPVGAIPGYFGKEYAAYFTDSPKTLSSYDKKIAQYGKDAKAMYAKQVPTNLLRDVTFTAKEVKTINKLNANLNFDTGWYQCKQMMQGNSAYTGYLGSGWNSWISKFKKAGVEDYVAVYQAAYDRAAK